MTTRIYSNVFSNGSNGSNPKISSDDEKFVEDDECNDDKDKSYYYYEDYELAQIYNAVKERIYNLYYFCFLEKSSVKSFSQLFDKKCKFRCKCGFQTINDHKIQSCQDFKRWVKNHEDVLQHVYYECLRNICSFEKWSEYAFLRSSECNCK